MINRLSHAFGRSQSPEWETRADEEPTAKVNWAVRNLVDWIEKHPGSSLIVALSTGVVLGWIVKRR